jgi:hypothetical protein
MCDHMTNQFKIWGQARGLRFDTRTESITSDRLRPASERLFSALHRYFVPVFAYVLVRNRGLPSRALSFAVFVGSQFPDLVDKPLAQELVVIPSGRVFVHSLLFAVLISVSRLCVRLVDGLATDC